jgi:hypothetical protein
VRNIHSGSSLLEAEKYVYLILNWFLSHRVNLKCLDILSAKIKTTQNKKASYQELKGPALGTQNSCSLSILQIPM